MWNTFVAVILAKVVVVVVVAAAAAAAVVVVLLSLAWGEELSQTLGGIGVNRPSCLQWSTAL